MAATTPQEPPSHGAPHIAVRTQWSLHHDGAGGGLSARAIALLVQVQQHGSLQAAAKALGLSYRHAWDVVQHSEAYCQAPLVRMERGKGSQLTALGEKLVWADRRLAASLKPVLDSLASEIAAELGRAQQRTTVPPLRLHASHGFAIERLVEQLLADGVGLALSYGTSTAAAAALRDGACDAAGFHLPQGEAAEATRAHYAPWLEGQDWVMVDVAVRRQGLMVRAGNPCEIFSLRDLERPGVQFVNRQTGSGTRLLLQTLLAQQGVDSQCITGFEQSQPTHAAVAAHVAAGMADVGFGLEPPARACRLDFVPVVHEDYFLLCRSEALALPAMQVLLATLRDANFTASVQGLPGYDLRHAGRVRAWLNAVAADHMVGASG